MKKYVLERSALPTNLPGLTTVVLWLLLDRLQPSGWVWGVCGTVMALLWVGAIAAVWQQETKKLPGFGGKDGE